MASQLFLAVLALFGCVKSEILPARCNTINSQCVGEGSTCSAQWNENCVSWSDNWSLCQKCADNTLVCHGGKCMRKTQGRGEQCYSNGNNHLWCQPQFSCTGNPGTCVDQNTLTQPTYFLARGETCRTNTDCYGDTWCDPYIHKCVNNDLDSTTQEVYCDYWSDCLWDEYCSPRDNTASPAIPSTCKKMPGGFGNRGGSLCKVPSSITYASGQCGWTQFCAQANEDEYDDGHTAYTATTCQRPFSIPEGGMCPPDISSGNVMLGTQTYNDYPWSYCASGPCVYSGSINAYRCTSADYTYAGTGCRQDDECGRGMFCGCPDQGGGRQRCMPDNTHQDWEHGRREWFDHFQPWLSCLEDHQCTLNNDEVGSCGQKYCADHLNWYTKGETTCTTGMRDAYYIDAPSYRGYADTIGAASHAAPSFFLAPTILALLYALIH